MNQLAHATAKETYDETAEMGASSVVLPITRSDDQRIEALLEVAVSQLAPGGTIHLVHVFSPLAFGDSVSRLRFDPDARPAPDTIAERHRSIVYADQQLNEMTDGPSPNTSVHGVISDETQSGILSVVEDVGAEHLIVGGRKRSPTGKVIFGSTAQSLLLTAPCPVTFVRGP